MKKIVGFVALAAIVFFLYMGIANSKQEEEVLSIGEIQKLEGVPVLTEEVKLGDVVRTNLFYGDIKSLGQMVVTSKMMDRIGNILVNVNDYVKKDQTLVVFDTTASQASVVQARLATENASRDYNRVKTLFEQGALSRQMHDGAKLQYDISTENYEMARSAVTLTAPSSGRVARIDFKAGALAYPGDAIITLITDDKLEVEFDVTQDDRPHLNTGQKVVVSNGNGISVTGKVTDASLMTSMQSRMFKITAKIPQTGGLYPGSLASVEVTIGERNNVAYVSFDALVGGNSDPRVFVVNGKIAKLRSIETGMQSADRIEVVSGLQPGEIVLTYGHTNLEDGAKVKIIKQ